MEVFILVPASEHPREVANVKAELTENVALTDAARLGAKKRRLLRDRTLTPDEKMVKLLPVSRTFARASNKLRQFNLPSTAGGPDEEDPINGDELVTPSIHKWMKRMVHAFGVLRSLNRHPRLPLLVLPLQNANHHHLPTLANW